MNTNSRLFLWPLLALLLLFQACNDDDDEMSREEMLIGVWTIQSNELTDYSITITGFPTPITKELAQSITDPQLAADIEQFEMALESIADEIFPPNTTITFSEDNNYVLTNDQNSTPPEGWSLSSNEQELILEIDDDQIDRLTFDILELTNNVLRVSLILDESELDLGVEEVESYTIEYTFSFAK